MGPPPSDPYAFLNDTKKPSPFSMFSGRLSNLSLRGKLIFAAGALILLVILLVIAKGLFGGHKNIDLTSIDLVLNQQQQLINLANADTQQQSSQYLNFSYTVVASVTTDQMKMDHLLSYNGIKVNPLSSTVDPSVNTQLQNAQQTSNFDPVYIGLAHKELQVYQKDLKYAYSQNPSPIVRGLLSADYNNTSLLLKALTSMG